MFDHAHFSLSESVVPAILAASQTFASGDCFAGELLEPTRPP